jgi:hypothetical protein
MREWHIADAGRRNDHFRCASAKMRRSNSLVLFVQSVKQRSGAIFARTVVSISATQACFAVRLSAKFGRLPLRPLPRVLLTGGLEMANVSLKGVRHPLS